MNPPEVDDQVLGCIRMLSLSLSLSPSLSLSLSLPLFLSLSGNSPLGIPNWEFPIGFKPTYLFLPIYSFSGHNGVVKNKVKYVQ